MPTSSSATSEPATHAPAGGLLHPVALAAIAVLVWNDHVGKTAYPGLVTGKLSDFAGLVFFPLLLQALVEAAMSIAGREHRPSRRLLVACAGLTGLVFALVKTWAPATEAYGLALASLQWPLRAVAALASGRAVPPLGVASVVRDPTDLFALPSLLVSVWVGWARGARGEGPETTPHLFG